MSKFKKGDILCVKEECAGYGSNDSDWRFDKGELFKFVGKDDDKIFVELYRVINDCEICRIGEILSCDKDILKLAKDDKSKPDDLVRYMAYGIGCDNKSEFMTTEKELKKKLNEVIRDSNWTGRIIGYKLIPILEAQQKTTFKVFKTTKIKKVVKKK